MSSDVDRFMLDQKRKKYRCKCVTVLDQRQQQQQQETARSVLDKKKSRDCTTLCRINSHPHPSTVPVSKKREKNTALLSNPKRPPNTGITVAELGCTF